MLELEGGLVITPNHPVKIDGKWTRPLKLKAKDWGMVDQVYNFVLETGHVMRINGVDCVTLGHEIDDKDI